MNDGGTLVYVKICFLKHFNTGLHIQPSPSLSPPEEFSRLREREGNSLNLQDASHTSIKESLPEFLVKSKGRSHSRAMGDADLPNLHPLERFDGFFQLLRG